MLIASRQLDLNQIRDGDYQFAKHSMNRVMIQQTLIMLLDGFIIFFTYFGKDDLTVYA